jgi:hypothetical protein
MRTSQWSKHLQQGKRPLQAVGGVAKARTNSQADGHLLAQCVNDLPDFSNCASDLSGEYLALKPLLGDESNERDGQELEETRTESSIQETDAVEEETNDAGTGDEATDADESESDTESDGSYDMDEDTSDSAEMSPTGNDRSMRPRRKISYEEISQVDDDSASDAESDCSVEMDEEASPTWHECSKRPQSKSPDPIEPSAPPSTPVADNTMHAMPIETAPAETMEDMLNAGLHEFVE